MSKNGLASAPFNPGGEYAIDSAIASKLLTAALASGGDYADLYFEYRMGSDYVLEDEQIKTVGRGITMGLGVRVLKGDATGYAYTQSLELDRMLNAAKTAGQIAGGGGHVNPVDATTVKMGNLYPCDNSSLLVPHAKKLELLKIADKAARGLSLIHI